MAANFTSVPILDYSLVASPATRPEFISQLRHALINVGFLYLSNPPIQPAEFDELVEYVPRVFALPQASKDAIKMANSQHFLGYSKLGVERTKNEADQREQFDFATKHECGWKEGQPDYLRLWGPAQWPEEDALPGFKDALLSYAANVEELGYEFITLIAEALGLPSDGLSHFFDVREKMQHRLKIVKYPSLDEVASTQGVGPHFDSGFLTFLFQASNHPGLQVQNLGGEWIDAPPIPYTFVVNIGKALEAVTQGLARATSHRVLAPPKGSTPRYSIPFFQNIAQELHLSEAAANLHFPPEVLQLKEARGEVGATDSLNYAEYGFLPSGQVSLIGRVKSHPDVAERHYPDLFKQFFPEGLPAHGTAY
ncbi:Clavaminate synthase-like protein [Amylostereum chailletii]|nr:Clavaminate synthase-like protein [Amylostereum chailletii]